MKLFAFIAILVSVLNPIQESDYVYNYEVKDNVVSSMVVYRKNDDKKYIFPKLKYHFTYDEEQRIVKKEVLRWNAQKNSWVNSHCLDFEFNDIGYTIEYRNWNEKEGNYTQVKEKQVTTGGDNGFLSVVYYEWNQEDNDWSLKSSMYCETTEKDNEPFIANQWGPKETLR